MKLSQRHLFFRIGDGQIHFASMRKTSFLHEMLRNVIMAFYCMQWWRCIRCTFQQTQYLETRWALCVWQLLWGELWRACIGWFIQSKKCKGRNKKTTPQEKKELKAFFILLSTQARLKWHRTCFLCVTSGALTRQITKLQKKITVSLNQALFSPNIPCSINAVSGCKKHPAQNRLPLPVDCEQSPKVPSYSSKKWLISSVLGSCAVLMLFQRQVCSQ